MRHYLKKLTSRYYRSKVTLKVYVKSHGVGYGDNGLGEFLISISRSNIFNKTDQLERLPKAEKDKIISAIQFQINKTYGYIDYDNFSFRYGFESWEVVKATVEPQVYWNWLIRLSFIPIVLFAALPTFFSDSNSNGDGFLFLLRYGIIYFMYYLLYVGLLYFVCYSFWGQVYGYVVRDERAINRIFILSIIAMSHGVFVDHGNRKPTEIEKFIVAPHLLLNNADWDKYEELMDQDQYRR